jgi:hypothetical protein
MATKCKVCNKSVYPMDPQINLDGSLFHKPCAKCADCKCQISLSNFTKYDNGASITLLCKTHYFKRFHEQGSYIGGDKFNVKNPRDLGLASGAVQNFQSPLNPSPTVSSSPLPSPSSRPVPPVSAGYNSAPEVTLSAPTEDSYNGVKLKSAKAREESGGETTPSSRYSAKQESEAPAPAPSAPKDDSAAAPPAPELAAEEAVVPPPAPEPETVSEPEPEAVQDSAPEVAPAGEPEAVAASLPEEELAAVVSNTISVLDNIVEEAAEQIERAHEVVNEARNEGDKQEAQEELKVAAEELHHLVDQLDIVQKELDIVAAAVAETSTTAEGTAESADV